MISNVARALTINDTFNSTYISMIIVHLKNVFPNTYIQHAHWQHMRDHHDARGHIPETQTFGYRHIEAFPYPCYAKINMICNSI